MLFAALPAFDPCYGLEGFASFYSWWNPVLAFRRDLDTCGTSYLWPSQPATVSCYILSHNSPLRQTLLGVPLLSVIYVFDIISYDGLILHLITTFE